ncbi:MAG TPA: (Fe-S)-binding protein [Pirellulaceae bacterium]
MRVGLFIPCFIDQLYPQVGIATLEVLERYGCHVVYPAAQTCCGQPFANAGLLDEARPLAARFLRIFAEANVEHVVAPSGSCVAMVRRHYRHLFGELNHADLTSRTWELCEFLVDILQIEPPTTAFAFQVGLHASCHGQRELRLGSSSEIMEGAFDKVRSLLERLDGIEFTDLSRQDECCGFGGTFAVTEAAVSVAMGRDRIEDHLRGGTQVLTATDMSCLMHLDGILRRMGHSIRVMHVAEILAGRLP